MNRLVLSYHDLRELTTKSCENNNKYLQLATKTKRKHLTIFPERTREGHRQSDEQWDRFKGVIGETSATRIIMGFSECIETLLN